MEVTVTIVRFEVTYLEGGSSRIGKFNEVPETPVLDKIDRIKGEILRVEVLPQPKFACGHS